MRVMETLVVQQGCLVGPVLAAKRGSAGGDRSSGYVTSMSACIAQV